MLMDFSKDTIMQLQSPSRQLCGHGLVEEKYWTENTKNTMPSSYIRRMLQSRCKQYFGGGDAKKSWHRGRLKLTRLIGIRTCLLQQRSKHLSDCGHSREMFPTLQPVLSRFKDTTAALTLLYMRLI